MNIIKHHRWTRKECEIESLKFNTRNEFIKNSRNAYSASNRNGWLDEICSHMNPKYKKWTKEKCAQESLKFSTIREFQISSKVAYNKSLKNGWLDELCSHMKKSGSKYKRCIYAIEFPYNIVYIGLTYNMNLRYHKHLIDPKSSVFKHIKLTGLIPIVRQISDYINVDDASKLEGLKKDEYIKEGWGILNISKCGSIGGSFLKWSKEICQEEALKYNTRNEFKLNSPKAYNAARRNKWINEICCHMKFVYNYKKII